MKIAAAFAFAVLFASTIAFADESAKGNFKSQSVAFDVAGSIAFRGTSSFNKDEPALIVAISNWRLAPALGNYLDRRRALDTLVKDEKTALVYFEFTPEGRYRGLSYYFGPGNGCGFCTSEVASTVKLANGRLAGALKGTEKARPFDVSIDVALMNDDHGSALPSDGGAPGKAYLAYHTALGKRDPAALRPTLSSDSVEVWDRAKKNGQLAEYVQYLIDQRLLSSVKIKKGWAKADMANLVVEGDGPAGALSGEVLLFRQQGAWVVDTEVLVK